MKYIVVEAAMTLVLLDELVVEIAVAHIGVADRMFLIQS